MRLTKFISESREIDEFTMNLDDVAETLKKFCSPYLKETKGNWFTRSVTYGTRDTDSDNLVLHHREIRQDRRPLGTEINTFNKLNKWLVENNHCDRSKSISCAKESSSLFGNRFIIFIEGNYKYTWLKGFDINESSMKTGWYNTFPDVYFGIKPTVIPNLLKDYMKELKSKTSDFNSPISDEVYDKYVKLSMDWLDKNFSKFFVSNKNMKEAWNKNFEIWFQAKNYYFIDAGERGKLSKIKNKLI